MHVSDWIALAAALAAFIGLIPQFIQLSKNIKKKSKNKMKIKNDSAQVIEQTTAEQIETKPLNGFGKSLVLASMGLGLYIIEIVPFSFIAHLFNIELNLETMPIN